MKNANQIVDVMLTFHQQIRLYHWSTAIHARHSASGDLYEAFDGLLDRFVESLQGRSRLSYRSKKIEAISLDDKDAIPYLKRMATFLTKNVDRFFESYKEDFTDLINIRDEMLALVNRSIFLFTMR